MYQYLSIDAVYAYTQTSGQHCGHLLSFSMFIFSAFLLSVCQVQEFVLIASLNAFSHCIIIGMLRSAAPLPPLVANANSSIIIGDIFFYFPIYESYEPRISTSS